MEKIKVRYYISKTNTIIFEEIEAYGLIEAIEIVRRNNNYSILVLSVEYTDEDELIASI